MISNVLFIGVCVSVDRTLIFISFFFLNLILPALDRPRRSHDCCPAAGPAAAGGSLQDYDDSGVNDESAWKTIGEHCTRTARGGIEYEKRARLRRCRERREKKSINNTDYWFWHRRWRGGRHHRSIVAPECTHRHHVTSERVPSSPPLSIIAWSDGSGGAY